MASERGPASEVVLAFDDEGESHSIHGSAYADEEAMADTLVRNPSLTRNHTGLSQDPYRSVRFALFSFLPPLFPQGLPGRLHGAREA